MGEKGSGLANEVRVALVLRVHRHGRVPEHRLETRRGDGDGLLAVLHLEARSTQWAVRF